MTEDGTGGPPERAGHPPEGNVGPDADAPEGADAPGPSGHSPEGSPGRLEAIWIKPERGAEMEPAEEAELVADVGIEGNAHRGGRRQVTVIAREAWEATRADLGRDVPPEARRANLMVRGLDLERKGGWLLEIGPIRLEIGGETRPCSRMDEAARGLKEALEPDWRGGVFGRVVEGGTVRPGDPASLREPEG